MRLRAWFWRLLGALQEAGRDQGAIAEAAGEPVGGPGHPIAPGRSRREQRELSRSATDQPGERHSDEPDRLDPGHPLEQREGAPEDLEPVLRGLPGETPRDRLKVGEPELEGDGPPRIAVRPQLAREI